MKLTFKSDFTPDGQAPNRPSYKAGETYEFADPVSRTYAQKYLKRGLAELATEAVAAPAHVEEPAAEIPASEILASDPLDHDGDGRKGGSVPKAGRGRRKG